MFYRRNQEKCDPDHVRYLEDELARVREDEQRRIDEAERQREERMRGYREQAERYNRTASTWPGALRRQADLFRREVYEDSEYPDDFFGPGADACERALVIWKEVEAAKIEAIAELERQIQAIKDSIRLEVAERLEAESEGHRRGWKNVAGAIAQIDEEDVSAWLDW